MKQSYSDRFSTLPSNPVCEASFFEGETGRQTSFDFRFGAREVGAFLMSFLVSLYFVLITFVYLFPFGDVFGHSVILMKVGGNLNL